MPNTFGHLLRVTTFGESHGKGIGAVVDGCPAGLSIDLTAIQQDLDRRRPGQSALTTSRREADTVRLLSGVQNGQSLGTPICLLLDNTDAVPSDYSSTAGAYRPSHADFTYHAKFGVVASSGGGRASARETAARVAAGGVAKAILRHFGDTDVLAFVSQVHDITADLRPLDADTAAGLTHEQVEATPVRCPDLVAAKRMQACIEAARDAHDSVGGVITCIARGVPAGWGEPVFDKLEAELARAMLSLPACKGFEVGSGFAGTHLFGSAHNDAFYHDGARVRTRTNNSGGIQGGISNGEPIVIRVAFKPTSTLGRAQDSVDQKGTPTKVTARGRHDPCVLPRAVPIVEAMMALVLADHCLRQRAQLK
jgi:chorismate synthase